MPKQIHDKEEFLEISKRAVECRVKSDGGVTKLKLRTKKYLYTLVIDPQEAQELLSKIQCAVVLAGGPR